MLLWACYYHGAMGLEDIFSTLHVFRICFVFEYSEGCELHSISVADASPPTHAELVVLSALETIHQSYVLAALNGDNLPEQLRVRRRAYCADSMAFVDTLMDIGDS